MKTKAWFRGLLRHPASKWIGPILQLRGPTRGDKILKIRYLIFNQKLTCSITP